MFNRLSAEQKNNVLLSKFMRFLNSETQGTSNPNQGTMAAVTKRLLEPRVQE